jgi:hypothetical protein
MVVACSSENPRPGEPTCLAEAETTDCAALYAPTFDAACNVISKTSSHASTNSASARSLPFRANQILDGIDGESASTVLNCAIAEPY